MNLGKVAACSALVLFLNGCDRVQTAAVTPSSVCSSRATQAGAIDALLDSAVRSLSGLTVGSDLKSAAAQEIERMRLQREFLTFKYATVEGYDSTTHRTSCSGLLEIKVPPEDRTGDSLETLNSQAAYLAEAGLVPPRELSLGAASTTVGFSEQPTASGDAVVYSVTGGDEAVSAIVAVALSRSTVRYRAAQTVQPPSVVATPAAPIANGPSNSQTGGQTYPASFDCARASTFSEQTICHDPDFARRDREVGELYRAALNLDKTGQIRAGARASLAARQACTTRQCVDSWLSERRDYLDGFNAR